MDAYCFHRLHNIHIKKLRISKTLLARSVDKITITIKTLLQKKTNEKSHR